MLHIYTGDGKGKTTAACGLAVRCCGCGKRVLLVQLLKNGKSGEVAQLEALGVKVLSRYPFKKFLWNMTDKEKAEVKALCRELFAELTRQTDNFDVVVIDEMFGALSENILEKEEVISYIKSNADKEIILTGRNAPTEIMEIADYISEIKCIRHPMEKGTGPRKGIEY